MKITKGMFEGKPILLIHASYKKSSELKFSFTYNKEINPTSGDYFYTRKDSDEEDLFIVIDELLYLECNNKHYIIKGAREIKGISYGFYLYQSKRSFRFILDFVENIINKEEDNAEKRNTF